jgi:hypothetical protein
MIEVAEALEKPGEVSAMAKEHIENDSPICQRMAEEEKV